MPQSVMGNQGILLPADTTANRPTSGDEFGNGCLRYNTSLAKVEGYINSGWRTFLTSDDVSFGVSHIYESVDGGLFHAFMDTTEEPSTTYTSYEGMMFFDNTGTSYSIDATSGKFKVTV